MSEHETLIELRTEVNASQEQRKIVEKWAYEQSKNWACSQYLVWQDLPTMYEAGYWKGVLAERARTALSKLKGD